jgi:tRNA A37 threonylcarbamoyladenosine synthetase subunit TsaC/SUA5/YrdC
MIVDHTDGKFDRVKQFVSENPRYKESFYRCLETLERIMDNNPEYNCQLFKDFAPHSLEFVFQHKEVPANIMLRGGLIFHGNPDESLSVQLVPSEGFALHT